MKTAGTSSGNTLKHVPQRTCIACREVQDKKKMIRLVCMTGGTVEADISGKKSGRGAYICDKLECWENGCKGTRLEHALKTQVSRENKDMLLAWIKQYLEDSNNIK